MAESSSSVFVCARTTQRVDSVVGVPAAARFADNRELGALFGPNSISVLARRKAHDRTEDFHAMRADAEWSPTSITLDFDRIPNWLIGDMGPAGFFRESARARRERAT